MPEYQSTALAMQHAAFMTREKKIPLQVQGLNLHPPFPALMYIYYNSKFPDNVLSLLIKVLNLKKHGGKNGNIPTIKGLYEAFVSEKIPVEVENRVKKCPPKHTCHSYTNALRFEFLRQVYSIVFEGISL